MPRHREWANPKMSEPNLVIRDVAAELADLHSEEFADFWAKTEEQQSELIERFGTSSERELWLKRNERQGSISTMAFETPTKGDLSRFPLANQRIGFLRFAACADSQGGWQGGKVSRTSARRRLFRLPRHPPRRAA
jgi:hypothetical protein